MTFVDEDDDPLNPQNEQRKAKAVQVREKVESEALARLRFTQDSFRRALNPDLDGSRAVLEDLKRFCRGGQTAWADDPRYHALLCGRQEVWLRIEEYLNLSFDDLVSRRS